MCETPANYLTHVSNENVLSEGSFYPDLQLASPDVRRGVLDQALRKVSLYSANQIVLSGLDAFTEQTGQDLVDDKCLRTYEIIPKA